jgi:hypothetical protein
VRHTRLREELNLDQLGVVCQRLVNHVGAGCDETMPGLLFDRSFGH